MKIIYAEDYASMSRKAANLLAAVVLLKPSGVLGLATGSTPVGTYRELIEKCRAGDLDFSQTRTVNLDEYVGLQPDDEQSYNRFMHANLFSQINIDPANTHLPDGLSPDSTTECQRYDALIQSLGGIDIQLLGIGANGHIGFNEPANAFQKCVHCVSLTESTIQANARFFASPEQVPTKAYTMGMQAIMQAKKIVLVANGAGKATILCDALFGPITPQVPASILQLHPDVTIIADKEALACILADHPDAVSERSSC